MGWADNNVPTMYIWNPNNNFVMKLLIKKSIENHQ